jgi:hypothetical protein
VARALLPAAFDPGVRVDGFLKATPKSKAAGEECPLFMSTAPLKRFAINLHHMSVGFFVGTAQSSPICAPIRTKPKIPSME